MIIFSEIEEDFERVKDQYDIEDNQIQLYEEYTPPSLTSRIGSNVIHGNSFIHTELRSIAVFIFMGKAYRTMTADTVTCNMIFESRKGVIYITKDHILEFISSRPEIVQFFKIVWLILQNLVNITIGIS